MDKRYGVIEIGPGIGVLTEQLCKRADKVVSIEVDKRLPPILAETMAEYENFKLVLEDVLKVDLRTLLAEEFGDKPLPSAPICRITSPAHSDALIGRKTAHPQHYRHGAERGCTALCAALARVRRGQSAMRCLLRQTQAVVYCAAGQLLPCPQSDQRGSSSWMSTPHRLLPRPTGTKPGCFA